MSRSNCSAVRSRDVIARSLGAGPTMEKMHGTSLFVERRVNTMDPGDALLDAPALSHGAGLVVVFVLGLPIVAYALLTVFRVVRADVRRLRAEQRTRRRGFTVLAASS